MVDTKSAAEATANWNEARGRVPAAYKRGVERATNVIAKSIAAEDVWVARVQEAASRRAREKGLSNVSDSDWKKAALDKGAARIGPGMAAAEGKFNKGISEVIGVLQGVSLPPRTADPVQNVQRVTAVVQAMVDHFRK